MSKRARLLDFASTCAANASVILFALSLGLGEWAASIANAKRHGE